ncbi:MAG: ClC family H(+)/Cl(-) exchange transporter [Spirochaetaceae bacterium]|nr:MAG: ClC family H(+)/Cl(-) exchange transporter [Spirochaetaceae bacterium]
MIQRIQTRVARWYSSRFAVFIESIIIGMATGLIVAVFRYLLEHAEDWRHGLYDALTTSHWSMYLLWMLGLALLGLVLGWINSRWPMIKGSGIPQIRGELTHKLQLSWWPELPLKMFGSVLAIGAGLSLGREGPSIQLGAYTGKTFLSVFRRPLVERKILMTSGAAAGLAAAFNAPLAGVLFVVEELHKHFSAMLVACAMGASLSGYMVVSRFFGLEPVFSFGEIQVFRAEFLPAAIILGAAAAIVGHWFKKAMYVSMDLYKKSRIPPVFRPILPLLLSVPIAVYLFDLSGGGHHLIQSLSAMEVSFVMLVIMLAVKLLFSAICYGSGVSGGIFLPLLACGALLGKLCGVSLEALGVIDSTMHLKFVILGMAAFFTSVVKTPVTGAVLILEMSGNFSHFSGLVACCISAFVVSDFIKSRSIYDVFLERILREQSPKAVCAGLTGGGAVVHTRREVIEVPVGLGSQLAHKQIRDVAWPEGILIVAIEHGEQEVIPKGGTEIFPGDRLLVYVPEAAAADIEDRLVTMAEARI